MFVGLRFTVVWSKGNRRLWTHTRIRLLFLQGDCLSWSLPGSGRAWRKLCLVNEASLIRIRTLINSPAELSGSSRRLTSLILPIQDGRTNGPGSPPRRCIHRQLLPAGDRERERGRRFRGKTMVRLSTLLIFIHEHCPRLARWGAARYTETYVGKKVL